MFVLLPVLVSNFIDVSAKSGHLDEDDLVERGQKYVKNLSDIPSASHMAAPSMAALSFGREYNSMELPQPSAFVVKRVTPPGASGLAVGLQAHAPATEVDYAALIAILGTAQISQQDIEFVSCLR